MTRWTFGCWLLLCLSVWPRVASGQSPKQQRELDRALELANKENFIEAISIWLGVVEGLDAKNRVEVQKMLGVAYLFLEQWLESWHFLSQYVQSSEGAVDQARKNDLQEVEGKLRADYTRVLLECSAPAAQVTISLGAPHGSTIEAACPAVWWFKAGKARVLGHAPGFVSREVEFNVPRTGELVTQGIHLAAAGPLSPDPIPRPTPGPNPAPGTPAAPEPVVETGVARGRTTEWILLGSGVAMVVTGAVVHGFGLSRNGDLHQKYLDDPLYDDCSVAKAKYDSAYDAQVRPKAITAYVLYGIGGVALVTSAVLRMWSGADTLGKGSVWNAGAIPGAMYMSWSFPF